MSDNPTRCTTTLPVDSSRLSNRPTESELMELLEPLVEWEKFAIFLPKMSNAMIRVILKDKSSTDQQKMALFSKWLRVDSYATWDKVIVALSKANEHYLVSKVQENLITTIPLVDHYQDTHSQDDTLLETSTNDARKDKPNDVKTKEESKEGSNLAQQSQTSTKIIKMSSKDQVVVNLETLHFKFTSIIAKVRSSLAETIKDGKHKLVDIALFVEEYTEGKGLTEIENIHELFNTIQQHYCFLNCKLIEKLVKEFLSRDPIQTKLEEYSSELEIFSESSQLRYIKTAIEEALLPKQEVTEISCKVIIKLHGRCEKITLKNFYKLLNYLFPTKEHFLTHIHIEPGSICVRLLAPLSQSQSLINMAAEKKTFMYKVGIYEMFINDQPIIFEDQPVTIEQSLLQAAQAGHYNDVIVLLELGADVDYHNEVGQTALMLATNGGHEQVVQTLISAGTNVNIQDYYGNSALMISCESNFYMIVILLLKAQSNPNLKELNGGTSLIFASKNGYYNVVELLLKENADPNLQNQDDLTALMFASKNGHFQVVELLLKENADLNLQDQEGFTALMFASQGGHYEVVELLLKENADPNLQNQEGFTALIFASENGHYQVVELLLKENADPNLQNQEGGTALIFSSENGHYQVVELLLKENADPNLQTQRGSTALTLASQNGHYQVVELLLKENVDPNLQQEEGFTGLMVASQNGHYQVVELLLKENADPNLQTQRGSTALTLASQNGHYQVVELLLKENADPNLQTQSGWTASTIANQNGHFEIVHLLEKYIDPSSSSCKGLDHSINRPIEITSSDILIPDLQTEEPNKQLQSIKTTKSVVEQDVLPHSTIHSWEIIKFLTSRQKCDVEVADKDGNRILHLACEDGSVDLVKHLVEVAGCDINAKGQHEKSCLHFACSNRKCHTEIVQFLFSKQDWYVEAADKNNNRPIHIACEHGSVDLVKYLVEVAGCDINAKGRYERSCLHFACLNQLSGVKIVQFLFSKWEWNIEETDTTGYRPLHLACEDGSVDLVKHLVEVAGCDINAKGQYERSCLHFACLNEQSGVKLEIIKFLTYRKNCDVEVVDENGDRILHLACQHGSIDLVKHLVKVAGCDVNAKDKSRKTCLHLACKRNDYDIVKLITSQPRCDLEAKDNDFNEPFIFAWYNGNVDICRHLICEVASKKRSGNALIEFLEIVNVVTTQPNSDVQSKYDDSHSQLLLLAFLYGNVDLFSEINCDVNTKGHGGYTPLHCACASNSLACVQYVTAKVSCDVEVENDNHDRPLHVASCFGSVDITRHLVETAGCDINSKGNHGYSPLHYACDKGHFEVAKYLIAQPSCNIEAEDDNHVRPIHLASRLGDTNILKYLINVVGCNVNAKGKNQRTCLHWACENNNFEAVKLITSLSTCNLESKDDDFIEPIQLALSNGNVDISGCLITEIIKRKRSGNDLIDYLKIVNMVTSTTIETASILSHQLPLLAALHGNAENVKSLLLRGDYDVNTKGHGGYTLLHCACASNNLACVEFLTAQINCDVEVQNDDHDRPLHVASCFGNIDITIHLVEVAGCDINSKGNHGYSPLHYACNRSHLEVVQFLAAQTHCNVEVEDDNHDRPLHVASRIGNVDIVKCLINIAGCDINAKGSNGYTSLHWVCEKGNFKLFCFLTTQLTCTANIPNDNNDQPLHIAARFGSIDIVRNLVEKKSCDVNAKGKSGYTPLHYACKHSSIEVMEYLLDHPDCDTDVLSSLSEYGDKRVQTVINFHNKFQLAMKSTGVAYLRVVKCILTGPPGAGKSTLKKRLLNESLIEPSLSTGVVDAGVLVDSFRKLQEGGMVPCLQNVTEWNKQNVDEEAVFILESVSSNTAGQHQVKPIRRKKYKSSSNQISSLLTEFVSASHENLDSQLTDQLAFEENAFDWETLISSDIEWKEGQQVQETVENSKNDNSKVKAVKVLSETVQTIPVTEREIYEEKTRQISQDNHAMLHIIDTGGQPEFHEILPALITGPAINLLVFKLTEDLRSRYHITYRSPTGESQPYETSFTHEEVIFRSLASIACLRQNTIGWSFKESPIDDDSEPAAFLIATHRDQVNQSKVTEVNEQLKAKIQKSKLFHENLVQFASPDQLIHAIDTTYDILEIDELRNMLHKVISNKFQELPIPVSWCTFSVKLRKINKSLHDINSCYELALECGITDGEDFMFALWFLHHRVGSIMYYPEVNGLKDTVITDLQLVFDRITHLITSCFTFKSSGNAALENEFRTTGQFTEEDIIKLSKKSDDPLSPVILVSLLRHLHIVAGPMSIKNGPKYYFMPCALKPAAIEEEQRDELVCPVPLLIYFECGYCPVGVFCCLVVQLLSKTQSPEMNWTLYDTPHFRNKIIFRIGKFYHLITLICRATYLEIWTDPTISTVPFYEIYQTLDKAIKTVTQSLHYMYKSRHFFGFPCTICQSTSPHPAICEYDDPVAAKCVQGGELMILGMQHTIWFDEHTKRQNEDQCVHAISKHHTIGTDSRFELTPNKGILLKLLAGISYLWFDIGEALQVPFSELMNLRYSMDSGSTKLSLVLQYWIDKHTTKVTWNTIIAAIKSETINQIEVGEKIQRHVLSINEGDESNISSGRGKEPASGRPYRRKGVLDKSSTSLPKSGHKKHKVTGDKRQRQGESGSDQSDGSHLSKQQAYHEHSSSDSDSESYDISSAHGEEPDGERSYRKKPKSSTLLKRRHQKEKGVKWQRPEESGSHKHSPSDSDSDSCDVSSAHGKEPAGRRPYKRKRIIDISSTLSKRGHQKCKGDKQQRLEESDSSDHLSKQQAHCKYTSPKSDSELYGISIAHVQETVKRRTYKSKGKKQRRLESKEVDSYQSKSTEISPRKQRHHYKSADSNSGSYDISHRHSKESTRRRPYKRKVMLDKGLSKYKKCKKIEGHDSDRSDDGHLSRKWQAYHKQTSPDSDSESCDLSYQHSKEPARGRHYKRKIKKTSKLLTREQKGNKRHRTEDTDSDQSDDHYISKKRGAYSQQSSLSDSN